jgi:PAS domain S-box-containing protein
MNIASLLDLTPWPELDPTPIVFTATGLIIAYGLFVVRLLDLVPIAHHTIFDTMDDGVIVVDSLGRIIDANPAVDRWLRAHYTVEVATVVGQPITRYFPVWADWVAGQPPDFLPVEDADVSDPNLRRYRPTISPLHDRRGRPLGHALILHNITRIKQIQDALRQSLEYREALYNALNDAIFVHDAVSGRMLDCNLRACELYGYTPEEMLGLDTLEPLSAGYAPYTLRDILGWMRKARTDGPQIFEWLGRRKDGVLFWVEVRLRYDVIGGQSRFIVSSHDISDRKQTQEDLRGSEARLNALLNAIPDLMFRIRRDGLVLDFHQRDAASGLALPESLVGQTLDVVMPQLARSVMHRLDHVLDEGGIAHDEMTLPVKGEPRYFDARMVACARDEAVMILRDITEQRLAEKQIFQVTLERERVDIMSSFIQDASHEFRTPLSVIQTNLHLLSRVTDPDKQALRRRNIEEQVMRITRLVDMLVTLSRLDSGVPLTYEAVDLNQLISQLVARVASAGSEKGVAVAHELDAALPYITADSDRLIDALEHLLDNAVRYTPRGGSVTVSTASTDGFVIVDVIDTGPGVAETIQPYIFSRFFRADVAHTTPGIGLGLAIAQKVVERHGGQIAVVSDGENGARFSINLPVAPQAPADG